MYFDSHLASFGALLALTTLAVDPFSQASVLLKPCEHVTGHVASIPRTNDYTRNVARTGTLANAPYAGMQLTIYRGVLELPDNSSVSIPGDCLTGNCTFPADRGPRVTSLAMCAYAWDVSDYIDGEMVDGRRNFSLGPELCGQYHEEVLGEQRLHWVFGSVGYQLAVNETLSIGSWKECHGLVNSTDANIAPVYPPPPSTTAPTITMTTTPLRVIRAGILKSVSLA
ncbi:hypothetical protein E5D57_011971 [Metarhizium anisopliae]|nr:hypothetical protein E5D57_011971 [Metarhizium anisopliae]